ncbi:hypothetical protein [Planctomycetes bacterium Pan216]
MKRQLGRRIASLEMQLAYPVQAQVFNYEFVTDGRSMQLRFEEDEGETLPPGLPVPNVNSLIEFYASIGVYSFDSTAVEWPYRLWSGETDGILTGQVGKAPMFYGPFLFPPVGEIRAEWADSDMFCSVDRFMSSDSDEMSNGRKATPDPTLIVFAKLLTESQSKIQIDGISGMLRDEVFQEAYFLEKSGRLVRLETRRRRFLDGVLLNADFPELLESTEVKYSDRGVNDYPSEVVTKKYQPDVAGLKLPKFSHYARGGMFDIPVKTVSNSTVEYLYIEAGYTVSDSEFSLQFPKGTHYIDRAVDNVPLVEGMSAEEIRNQIAKELKERAEHQKAIEEMKLSDTRIGPDTLKVTDWGRNLLLINVIGLILVGAVLLAARRFSRKD